MATVSPITNFNNINNSEIDYGDVIVISGSVVSYEDPYVEVQNALRNYTATINNIENEKFLYESNFRTSFSSTLCGDAKETIIVYIRIFDGITIYQYSLSFILYQIRINISSPSNNMLLDLTYSLTLKIGGYYYSKSNSSNLQILYGSFWYVEDRDDENSTFWINMNKSTGSEWLYIANSSKFINGDNLVKVRIFNNDSSYIDTIRLKIMGLEKIITEQSHSTVTTQNSSNTIPIPPRSEEFPFTLLFIIVVPILFIAIIESRRYLKNKAKERIINKKIDRVKEPEESLANLKKILYKKSRDLKEIQRKEKRHEQIKKDVFKPKRRRT